MPQNRTLFIGIDDIAQKAIGKKEKFFKEFFVKDHLFSTVVDTPDNLVKQGHKFLYVIYITHFKDEIPLLDSKVTQYIKEGRCKFIIFYPHEGHVYRKQDIEKFIDYCKIHNLSKTNTFFYHSNLELKNQLTNFNLNSNYFSIESIVYFEHNPWFLTIPSGKEEKNKLCSLYKNRVTNDYEIDKQYYFNCLNRLPRYHRLLLYVLNHTNEQVRDKMMMSLGPPSLFSDSSLNKESFSSMFSSLGLEMQYLKFLDKKQREWESTGLLLDTPLLENPTNTLNLFIYKQSYISIVSETEVDSGTLFFSEKTFKPIVAGHPFISMNGKHSLKHLQNLGYKTFSKWWDESYDEIDDWRERVLVISKLVNTLCQLDKNTIRQMTVEMNDVLLHNIDMFFNNTRELTIYDRLFEIQSS